MKIDCKYNAIRKTQNEILRLGYILRIIGRHQQFLESVPRRRDAGMGVDSDNRLQSPLKKHALGDLEAAKMFYQGCIEVERNTSGSILVNFVAKTSRRQCRGRNLLRKGKGSAW